MKFHDTIKLYCEHLSNNISVSLLSSKGVTDAEVRSHSLKTMKVGFFKSKIPTV